MRTIGRSSELEGLLRVKNDEVEVSRGVVAECVDLQAHVASLRAELEQSSIGVTGLSIELTEKVPELEGTEEARVAALAKAEALEDSICVLMSECATDTEMATLMEARLDERIGGLDKDVSSLLMPGLPVVMALPHQGQMMMKST